MELWSVSSDHETWVSDENHLLHCFTVKVICMYRECCHVVFHRITVRVGRADRRVPGERNPPKNERREEPMMQHCHPHCLLIFRLQCSYNVSGFLCASASEFEYCMTHRLVQCSSPRTCLSSWIASFSLSSVVESP